MEFKLVEYPAKEATEIVDVCGLTPENARPGIEFYYNDDKYKILDVKLFAVKVNYDDKGNRYFPKHQIIDPLKDSMWPQIIVTKLSQY